MDISHDDIALESIDLDTTKLDEWRFNYRECLDFDLEGYINPFYTTVIDKIRSDYKNYYADDLCQPDGISEDE